MKKSFLKRKMLFLAICAVTLTVLTFGIAQATTFTWNFDVPTGPVSSPNTYLDTTNTFAIVASGFTNATVAPTSGTWTLVSVASNALFGKQTLGDPGETGLGLAGQPNFEIQPMTLIQLDLQDLIDHGLTNEIKIISSIQLGETVEIFKGDIAAGNGATAAFVTSGTGNGLPGNDIQTFTFAGPITSRYEWITATSGDVLVTNGLAASSRVPEPTTLLLLGFGLMGLVGIRRFKK